MTSKAIFYYSETGKTEAAIDKELLAEINIVNLNKKDTSEINFNDYDTIIIGTPTYGRGVPPVYFKNILTKIYEIKDKTIGLFGSGNTIYGENYCGALDVLEEILKRQNKIKFKYKFEGYPRDKDIANITKLILED